MIKPQTRLPRTTVEPAVPTEPARVAPAPDNGVPFAQQASPPASPAASASIPRRGKQLGARIPVELYERLVACSAGTHISQNALVTRALEVELKGHGF